VIQQARLAEPLVRTAPTSEAEDTALAHAVAAFRNRTSPDDFSALNGFIGAYPRSGWSTAVLTNLGLAYLHAGYFSRAIDALRQAWLDGRDATAPDARALVDRAIGERARLYASFGQFDLLQTLFDEIGNRPITGSATEALQTARETLTVSKRDPRHLFLCGPMALQALLMARGTPYDQVRFLDSYRATPDGTSLAEVAGLADKLKLGYRLVFRAPGQPIPDQAIVHWKVGHFAAIVGQAHGRIHIDDPVFAGNGLWITPAALDAEASGYFLVPDDVQTNAAWRVVEATEASRVWGKGPTSGTQPGNPGGPPSNTPKHKGDCPLCDYNIAESNVALTLSDVPVGYDPPIGPSTRVTVSYNQREDSQPANFAFYNIGQKWTLSWLAYVIDDPRTPGATVSRFMSGGGAYYYTGYNSKTGRFTAQDDDGSILVLSSGSPASYERQLADGSVEIYAQSDGATSYPRHVFLSEVLDPQGNALHLNYDSQDRLSSVTDATGRQTTLAYDNAADRLKVTKITDPFGRSAVLAYDSSNRLLSITDIIGLTSQFTYDANSLVNSLITPYGTTSFAYTAPGTSGPPRFLQVTDPLGNHEREEWLEPAPIPASDPSATVPVGMPLPPENDYHQYRDSFHWDKDQYVAAGCTPTGGCDYSKARDTHFAHAGNLKSSTIESLKQPLENRVWYQYPGQPDSYHIGSFEKPIATARVLDDGSTQLSQFAYDTTGFYKPTRVVDPLGRMTSFTYSNQIDLTGISQTTAGGQQITLAQYIYNTHHRPLYKVDAASQLSSYTYNAAGQILTSTDPLGHVTQYRYNATGDLTEIVNADGVIATSYTYDAYDRVATATDSQGYTVSYAYDAADRPTVTTYPDGTTVRYAYDKLDLASYTDRLGRTWRYVYDANGDLTAVTDPAGKTAALAYDPAANLTSMTDANGNATGWTYDIESRPTAKTYAGGSQVIYTYEATTSRLKSRTDPLGQVKQYAYASDDQVRQISYVNAVNPTATAAFAYDPWFPRLVSMTDGIGTTQYAYGPVGSLGALQVVQTTGPPSGATIGYAYDALGRLISRTVAGESAETFQYDALGRLVGHNSDLGSFTLSYMGETGQITERALGGTTLKTDWSYLPNSGDRRLKEIDNTGLASGAYSNFQIASDAGAQITGVNEASDATTGYPVASSQSAIYNNLNQITSLSGQTFTYDADGNLTSDGIRTYSWDAENRLIAIGYAAEAGKATGFTYDGLGRRVAISRTPAGGGSATITDYIWCGQVPCQARDASGTPIRDYLAEGEYLPGTTPVSLYYGIDQIGSVRRVFSSDGSSPAYAYDPYGNPLQATTPLTDAGYAGMFHDSDSGLSLTLNRVYEPATGRWLSRDPLGERVGQGTNLYPYAAGNPISLTDPYGLFCWPDLGKALLTGLFWPMSPPGGLPGLPPIPKWLTNNPGLIPTILLTEAVGGGPEDTLADAAVYEEIAEAEAETAAEEAELAPQTTCCFVAGTLVSTKVGLKPIEKLRVGDLVLSRDPASGKTTYKPITSLIHRHDREIYELTIAVRRSNGKIEREVFDTTDDHPWRSVDNRWIRTIQLKPRMRLVRAEGTAGTVLFVRDTGHTAPTYNIEVADFHTYFVGNDRVWVHNDCGPELRDAIEQAIQDELEAQGDLYHETYSISNVEGPDQMVNPDPSLGPNQVRYNADMTNGVTGQRTNYSVNYDPATGEFGIIKPSGGK
jgi:RHS repeat-associated protein